MIMDKAIKPLVDLSKMEGPELEAFISKAAPYIHPALNMIGLVTIVLMRLGITLEELERRIAKNALQEPSPVRSMGDRGNPVDTAPSGKPSV
jgi:hypothetical protein